MTTTRQYAVADDQLIAILFANLDEIANLIENHFDISLSYRADQLIVKGRPADIELAVELLSQLEQFLAGQKNLDKSTVVYLMDQMRSPATADWADKSLAMTYRGEEIYPRTRQQMDYSTAIERADIVLGIGPAGTGKTFIAVTMALSHLMRGSVEQIVISRPIIQAGENLGFLPGDFRQKVAPYLVPIVQSIHKVIGRQQYESYIQKQLIEVVPLAYMRGRTMSNAFIILDEAQNVTIDQMKMFLTRLGFGSKIVINGDLSQIDLANERSGLAHAVEILSNIAGIEIVNFKAVDVIRHQLVKQIIAAYDKDNQ